MKSKFSILVVLVLLFVILCCASCNRLINDDNSESDNSQTESKDFSSTETDKPTPITTEPTDESNLPTSIMPDQSYVGVWYTDENRTDEILIYEITDNSVKFNSGIYRLFGFTATAIESDGEIVFGDGVSPDYSGPDMIRGRLRFENDSVTVIYDNFGNFDYLDSWSNIYQFANKDDNSDNLVEQFKEARHLD